jgi:RNA polymerase sigma factor (sigma-70 family)
MTYRLMVERIQDRDPYSPLEVSIRLQKKDPSLPQTQIDERGMMEALISTMNTELSEDQRVVIILRFIEDFSLKEIGEIIGKDVNNVKVIQTRGIAKLKKAMGMETDPE